MEFAITFPLLLVFLGIAIDLARLVSIRLTVGQVAHDTARYATIRDPETGNYPAENDVRSRALASLPTELESPTLLTQIDATVGGVPAVSVEIRGTVSPWTPLLGGALGPVSTLAETAWHPKR